jgi:hypothetical protein
MDDGSSVTLIFYRLGPKWYNEPWLNVLAAFMQRSSFTHVEIAIGEKEGTNGTIANVCRVFNDNTGVELIERTGLRPNYIYLQLGCSKSAVRRMLKHAQSCVGKPFSNLGMARSILWPRKTDETSFFCAELVASILQSGGLFPPHLNPGAATPESLHEMYRKQAAVTGNPHALRKTASSNGAAFGLKAMSLSGTGASSCCCSNHHTHPNSHSKHGYHPLQSQTTLSLATSVATASGNNNDHYNASSANANATPSSSTSNASHNAAATAAAIATTALTNNNHINHNASNGFFPRLQKMSKPTMLSEEARPLMLSRPTPPCSSNNSSSSSFPTNHHSHHHHSNINSCPKHNNNTVPHLHPRYNNHNTAIQYHPGTAQLNNTTNRGAFKCVSDPTSFQARQTAPKNILTFHSLRSVY